LKTKTKIVPFLALFSASIPTPSISADHAAVEEVVVSATRRDAAASEISAAVSVVDADSIRSQKLLTDALADALGVFVQQTTPGQGAAVIRGLKGSSILHLVDQMRLNNAIFRSAPTQYLALVPTTAVERIEVLRGTPTSLYGSDAVGGIVHLVTRIPTFDAVATEVSGEVSASYGTADLGKTLRGTLDVGNREVATTVSVEHLRTGNRRVGGGQRVGPSGYDAKGGRFAMSVTPDDKRAWLFDVHYMKQANTPRIDELVPGFGQNEPSSSEYFFAPNRRIFAHARFKHAHGAYDLDWRFDLGWQRVDDDRITRDFESTSRRYEKNRSDLTAALITASRSTGRGSWIAGVEVYHDRVRSRREEEDISNGLRQDTASRFPDRSSLDQAAIFFNGDVAITARQALSGGLRLSSVRVELQDTPVSVGADIDVTDISGDIGWRYNVNDAWQLVANAGYGFRAPNIFDLGTLGDRPGNRFNIPNTMLDSERVLQADVGVRRRGDGWQLELMLYTLDYDDRITSVSTGATTPDGRDIVQSMNLAESTINGVEFGASVGITENFNLQAAINYSRGEQEIAGVEEPADRIPPLGGRLVVDYDNGGPMTLATWVRFANGQDRLSARDVTDSRIDPKGTAGWISTGITAKWLTTAGWEFALGVDNALDQRYRNHGSGIDAPGRNLSVSVRYAW